MPVRRSPATARRTATTSRHSPASVIRTTEASGESPRSWDSAVAAAVKAAAVKTPVGVEVARMWAEWDGRRLSRYRVTVKVAYRQRLKAAR